MGFQIGPNMDGEWIRSLGIDPNADQKPGDVSITDLEKGLEEAENAEKAGKKGAKKKFRESVGILFGRMYELSREETVKMLKTLGEKGDKDKEISDAAHYGIAKSEAISGEKWVENKGIKVEITGDLNVLKKYGLSFVENEEVFNKHGIVFRFSKKTSIYKAEYADIVSVQDMDKANFTAEDVPEGKRNNYATILSERKDKEKIVIKGNEDGTLTVYCYYKGKDGSKDVEICKFHGKIAKDEKEITNYDNYIHGSDIVKKKGTEVILNMPDDKIDKGAAIESLFYYGLSFYPVENSENEVILGRRKESDKLEGAQHVKIEDLEIKATKNVSISSMASGFWDKESEIIKTNSGDYIHEVKLDLRNIGKIEIEGSQEEVTVICYSKDGKTADIYRFHDRYMR